MRRVLYFLLLSVMSFVATPVGSQTDAPEAVSLFGKPLFRMALEPEQKVRLEADLDRARRELDRDPTDPDNIIWLGRRLAYLWRYRDAIDVFTKGIGIHPNNYRLYRHRGHRYITLRSLDEAVADLERAASLIEGVPDEIEPDGAPNAAGKPRSTTHSNIWYHLGLAYYLKGDFENAGRSYQECMKFSRVNDDMLVATADWLYMTYRRLGRNDDADDVLKLIREDMDIVENHAYHKRLLMYQGLVEPATLINPDRLTELDLVTQGYGVANWYFVNGDKQRAKDLMEKIHASDYWAAFGYIAAEADLSRWPED